MREDKSPCKCNGRKHESLAYNWLLGRAMVLGSFITVSGRLIFLAIVGQGPVCCGCIFFSHLHVSCLPLSFPFLRGHGLT